MKILKVALGSVLIYLFQSMNANVATEQTRMEVSDQEKIQNMRQGRAIYGLRNQYAPTNQNTANGMKPSSVSETRETRTQFKDTFQSRNSRDLMGSTPQGDRPSLERLAPANNSMLK